MIPFGIHGDVMARLVWFCCSPRYFVPDEHGPSLHSTGCQFCPPSNLNTAASNMKFKKGPSWPHSIVFTLWPPSGYVESNVT